MTRFTAFRALVFAGIAISVSPLQAEDSIYLALGDSVPFGLDIRLLPPIAGSLPKDSKKFSGYPEVVASTPTKWTKLTNAACPGETSASFLSLGAPDNGCQNFKAAVGLHVAYSGQTQLSFALATLAAGKDKDTPGLITLGIGGNDLLLLQQYCSTSPEGFEPCVLTRLEGVLQAYEANLAQILIALRSQYKGTLVLVNQYSPSADPLFTHAVFLMNQVMAGVGANFGARLADAFTAFQIASAPADGDPCNAGLLIRLNATTCDVHPSALGDKVLAASVGFALADRAASAGD